MSASENGFVALWHNVPAEIDEEYNLVHTREHVLDYVANAAGRGGIDFGRRYGQGEGQLPRYFMFYPAKRMTTFAELHAKPWAEHPGGTSDWFNAILDQYRDSWRNNCRMLGEVGGGTGGAALAIIMNLADGQDSGQTAINSFLEGLIALPAVTAARLGITDPAIGPNRPNLTATDQPVGVLVVEGFDRLRLARAVAEILAALTAQGIAQGIPKFGLYQLSYEVRPDDLDQIAPYSTHSQRW